MYTALPKYFQSSIAKYNCSLNTRRSVSKKMFLSRPAFKNNICKSRFHFTNSFDYDAPSLWNNLPDYIRTIKSHSEFRNKLKTFFFKEAFPP